MVTFQFLRAVLVTVLMVATSPLVIAATASGNKSLVNLSNLPANTTSIRVTGPQGFVQISKDGHIKTSADLPDGQYRFEIYASSNVGKSKDAYKQSLNNGRASNSASAKAEQVVFSGYFRLQNGLVLNQNSDKE